MWEFSSAQFAERRSGVHVPYRITFKIMSVSWWQDAQRAVRLLRRQPLFALGVILLLAIGIGPLVALSSLMNVAFLRPWQVPDPDRLAIFRARRAAGEAYGEISIAEYRFLREHS